MVERFRALKISVLNHSVMGATGIDTYLGNCFVGVTGTLLFVDEIVDDDDVDNIA